MLDYHLLENLMTPAADDAMAQTVNVRSYSNDQIADLMLQRGTMLTKADILAVLEVYRQVIVSLVEDGAAVNTSLYYISPSISGIFNGLGDSFDASRHRINVNLNAGTDLREAAKRIKTKKVEVADPVPHIIEVKDIVSSLVNETLTPGGVIQLRGSRLKLIEATASNGIFLLPETGGDEIKLTVIAENKPARLIAMLPADLPQGAYKIEVRTTYMSASTTESKAMRTGRFGKTLTV
jgi:hypothetical protein